MRLAVAIVTDGEESETVQSGALYVRLTISNLRARLLQIPIIAMRGGCIKKINVPDRVSDK